MNLKYYIILPVVWVCFCFPSGAFGQYIKKETVNGKDYAVIYSEGLAGAAQWNLGFKMMRNGATIRHQVTRGTVSYTHLAASSAGNQVANVIADNPWYLFENPASSDKPTGLVVEVVWRSKDNAAVSYTHLPSLSLKLKVPIAYGNSLI